MVRITRYTKRGIYAVLDSWRYDLMALRSLNDGIAKLLLMPMDVLSLNGANSHATTTTLQQPRYLSEVVVGIVRKRLGVDA
jgi:hypothetical protein